MNTKLKDVNVTTLKGTIVNRYDTEKVTILTVGVSKRDRKGNFISNYPRIFFFKKNGKCAADGYELHDKVAIKAYLASEKRKKEEKEFFSQSVIGKTIEPMKTVFEEVGVKAGRFEASVNEVTLVGTVLKYSDFGNGVARIIIKEEKNPKFYNKIVVSVFLDKKGILSDMLQVGNKVCIMGEIRTAKKEYEGKDVHMQNVVAVTVAKVDIEA